MLGSAPWIFLLMLALGCSESDSADEKCDGDQCNDVMTTTPTADAGADSDADPGPPPDAGVGMARLSPERFEFSYVEPGDQQQQTVVLTNGGDGTLRLRDFAGAFSSDYLVYWQNGRPALPLDEQEVGIRDGESSFPDEIEVMPGDAVLFTLVYRPTVDGNRGGAFALTADRELRIPIEHSDDRPIFTVEPNPVEFGMVPAGARRLEFVKLTNVGAAVANLEEVSITGSEAFEISIEGRDPEVDSQVLANPDRDLQPGVGIGKDVNILIRFQSEDEMPATAEIRVVSNAVNGEILIPVTANGR